MKKKISVLLWILAFILSAIIFIYQRRTGPTHPLNGEEMVAGKEISYRFLRAHIALTNMPVEITTADQVISKNGCRPNESLNGQAGCPDQGQPYASPKRAFFLI